VFGHVAIGINGRVFSFGTNWTLGPPGVQDWGVDQSAYLAAQQDVRATDILTLNISEKQEEGLLQHLQAHNPNAAGDPPYALLSNSCTTVCKRSMEGTGILADQIGPATIVGAGNVKSPSPPTPDALVQSVRRAGLVKSSERVGKATTTGPVKALVNTVREDSSR